MKLSFLFFTLILGVAQMSAQLDIKYEKHTLPNGLQVIFYEDHDVPLAAVNLWYHVGSAREKPGRTGFAHLFEHMMFQGSQDVQKGEHFRLLEEAGGTLNGSTSTDRTNYWEVVPENFLELALWLESDRMATLLTSMDQEKLDNQRDVVKNERRQNYENRPYGLAWETIAANLYPPEHPYHWLTIGSMADLSAASLEDVKEFFRTYYTSGNASLAVGGDINPAEVKKLVEKYFGSIDNGKAVPPMKKWEPALTGQKYLLLEDQVQLPRLYIAWPSVPEFAKDDATLDLLSGVLSAGKNSRLYKTLVYDRQIAQDVTAMQNSSGIAGSFMIIATAVPGRTLTELTKAIDEEVAKVVKDGVTPRELERVKNQTKTSFIYSLQHVGGFGGVTDQLNRYNVFLGDPGYFNKDLARYTEVTATGLQQAAKKYLPADRRVILSVVPKGKQDLKAGS